MSQDSKKIAEMIDSISHKREHGLRFPMMSGKIYAGSVDETAMTVSVVFNVDMAVDASGNVTDGFATEDINLNLIVENKGGVYLIPADGAYCIVAEIDGPGKWELLKASAYTKIVVQASTLIQFNDGSLGGLTKTKVLQTQINKLNTLVAHLIAIINGVAIPEPGSGAASALQAALKAAIATDSVGDFSGIENSKITQG